MKKPLILLLTPLLLSGCSRQLANVSETNIIDTSTNQSDQNGWFQDQLNPDSDSIDSWTRFSFSDFGFNLPRSWQTDFVANDQSLIKIADSSKKGEISIITNQTLPESLETINIKGQELNRVVGSDKISLFIGNQDLKIVQLDLPISEFYNESYWEQVLETIEVKQKLVI